MVCTCFLCLVKSRRTEKVGDTRTITANKWLGALVNCLAVWLLVPEEKFVHQDILPKGQRSRIESGLPEVKKLINLNLVFAH